MVSVLDFLFITYSIDNALNVVYNILNNYCLFQDNVWCVIMNDRFFSDSVQYQAVLLNLEKNNGQLKCALCGKILVSKSECHFDHILAYAKGGKSSLDNCQILCSVCNLSKSDKDMQDFLLEEKAKRFMAGENIEVDITSSQKNSSITNEKMTKERFDEIVGEFIKNKGDIKKVDFTRDKNGLPSVAYVTKYYGTMNELKMAFGIKPDVVWNRDDIWKCLVDYSKLNPDFKQADLVKANNLPSLPCVLSYFPEYKNFSDIKIALGLELNYELWSKEKVVEACKKYLKTNNKITQKDLKNAPGFEEALRQFELWLPDGEVEMVSWSRTDLKQLQNEMQAKSIVSERFEKIFETWNDCQKTFSNKMEKKRAYSLEEALIAANIIQEGQAHDGLSDAYNTALLFAKMAKEPHLKLNPIYEEARSEKVNHLTVSMGEFFGKIDLSSLPES